MSFLRFLVAAAFSTTVTVAKEGEWTCGEDGFWYQDSTKTSYACDGDGGKGDYSGDKDDYYSWGDKDDYYSWGDKDDYYSSDKDDYYSPGDKGVACTDTIDPNMPPTYPRSCVSTGDRCWYTYTPPQVDSGSTYPLVVDLHGGGGCASHSAASSGWQKLAEGNDEDDTFIVIWPQGSGGGLWGVGGSEWSTINAETSTTGKDTFDAPDLEFLAEIIASSNAPIDLERIYFTGFSMGGMMSLRFLLEKSDLIAGAHCHGGYLVSPEDGTSITPSKSVGVYMTGGDEDAWYAMSEDQFDVWTNFNDDECVESTTSVTLTGSYLTDATLKRCGNVGRLVVAGMTHVPDERMASLAWEALKGLSRTSVTHAPSGSIEEENEPEADDIEEKNVGDIESTLLEGGGMLTEALGFWTTSFAVLVTILGNF